MTVGWQVAAHMEDSLVISALEKALQWRKPASGLIVHRTGDPVGSGWSICFQRVKNAIKKARLPPKYEPG